MGSPEKALEPLLESLQLRRSVLGADHPLVATVLHGLATVYLKLNDDVRADEMMEMAWRISDSTAGSEHPKTLQYLCERGLHLVTWGQDRVEEGLRMVREAGRAATRLPSDEPLRARIKDLAQIAETIANPNA